MNPYSILRHYLPRPYGTNDFHMVMIRYQGTFMLWNAAYYRCGPPRHTFTEG